MDSAAPKLFKFGDFRLDAGRRTLLDGDLNPVALPTKAFDALVYLARNAGRVVERAELMDVLWPRAVVEDNTLSQVVLRLRTAIGEEWIVTVHGRGYQFVEEIRSSETAGRPNDGHTKATVTSRSRLAMPSYRLAASVALVFGFLSLGAYWVATRESGRVPALQENDSVAAPISAASTPSSRAYELYLSGRRYASRGKADANVELAIHQYRRAVDEDPGLAMAWVQLSALYSESYFFREDASEQHGRLALEAAEKALALDPDLPEAHLAMASYLIGTADFLDALNELEIAELGMPQNAKVPWLRGHIYMRAGRLEEALAAYERAVDRSPGSTKYFEPAIVYQLRRDYAKAERYYDRILELYPDHVGSQVAKAWLPLRRDGNVSVARAVAAQRPYRDAGDLFFIPSEYFGWLAAFYERDYQGALRYLDVWSDDALRVTLAEYIPKASLYGVTYDVLGEHERADAYFRRAVAQVEAELKRNPELPELWIALGEAFAWLEDGDAALDATQNALEMVSASDDFLFRSTIELGASLRVFVPLGDLDAALAGLDNYFGAPGIWSIEGMLPDPRLDPIRDDPRFRKLVDKYSRH